MNETERKTERMFDIHRVEIEWGGRKVLLAGDVENGKRSSPKSGWKGVLRILDDVDDPRGHLVDDVDVVKVAHHGSKGAFFPAAWQRHAKTRRTTAILAPFSPSPLPSDPTLIDLRVHCAGLGISAAGGSAFARARAAGWAGGDAPVFMPGPAEFVFDGQITGVHRRAPALERQALHHRTQKPYAPSRRCHRVVTINKCLGISMHRRPAGPPVPHQRTLPAFQAFSKVS